MNRRRALVAGGLGVALGATLGGVWMLSPAGAEAPGTTGGQALTTPGGVVVASCQGDLAVLEGWTPGDGYRADHAVRGPAAVARVEFESDVANDVTVTVSCANGAPTASSSVEFDDHGGVVDRDNRTEPGDDRDRDGVEPGDDNGGDRDRDDRIEPGDDRDGRNGDDDSVNSGPGSDDSGRDDDDDRDDDSGHGSDDDDDDDHDDDWDDDNSGHGSDD